MQFATMAQISARSSMGSFKKGEKAPGPGAASKALRDAILIA